MLVAILGVIAILNISGIAIYSMIKISSEGDNRAAEMYKRIMESKGE